MDDAQIDHELAQLLPDSPTEHRFRARRRGPYNLLLVNFIVLGLVVSLEIFSLLTSGRLNILLPWDLSKLNSKTRPGECNGYLPNLLATDPPRAHDPPITKASEQLDKYLSKRASEDGVDALYVAVVTSEGVLFEGGYGSARANETSRADRGIVDKDTIFRIASVSKLFTTLETLILRERGALNWDDPVTKYLPDFEVYPSTWDSYFAHPSPDDPQPRITLRQLASHMSGLGRIHPPYNVDPPLPEDPEKPPPYPIPSQREETMTGLKRYPLVAEPYSYPIYSNTAFGLLGWANVAADIALTAEGGNSNRRPTKTHDQLVARDIFGPLGMDSSFFKIPPALVDRIAIPKTSQETADVEFGDASPWGGQYSSGHDLTLFMQTLLNPALPQSLLTQTVVNEWLRPLHVWIDGINEVGAPWEIFRRFDSYGRAIPFYQKSGSLAGYGTQFIVNPKSSYGIIVLATGRIRDVGAFNDETISTFQPAFDRILSDRVAALYAGTWTNGSKDKAVISVEGGTLWIKEYTLQGKDVLKKLKNNAPGGPKPPFAMWPTGKEGEFRITLPLQDIKSVQGCLQSWVTLDGAYSHGAPLDLIYFSRSKSDGEIILNYPTAGVMLMRL